MNISDSAKCPACEAMVEPEQDGDLIYYPCGCGFEFNYTRIPQQDEACQAGIPEDIRRAAQPAPEATSLPLLQIGRRP